MQFIFGQSTDTPDAQELQRRREIVQQLRQRSIANTPRNVGEGIAAIGQALSSRLGDRRLAPMEAAERERISAALAGFGGMGGGFGGMPAASGSIVPTAGTPTPPAPTPVNVAETATTPDALDMSAATLIGVNGSGDNMTALVRGPDGNIIRAPARGEGDMFNVEGFGVAGVGSPFGGGSPAPAAAPSAQPASAPAGGAEAMIRQGLLARGLPEHVADAFIMNFRDESGLDPGIEERVPNVHGTRGFGLYQLTGPRRTAYEQFARERGVDPSDVNAQLDFMMMELQGPESGAAQRIMSAPDTGTAASAIVSDFLRPAAEHRDRRIAQYTGAAPMPAGGQGGSGQGGMAATVAQLSQIIGNPYATDGQRAVAQALLQQQMQAADPMRQLQMQQLQMQINQMQNPQSDPMAEIELERARIELEALRNPAANEPAAVQALRIRAAEAGLQPGTPEYQEFMATGGAASGTTVNVQNTMPGQDTFNDAFARQDAEAFAQVSNAGIAAQRNIGRIDRLAGLLEQSPSGFGAALRARAGEFGINTEGLSDLQSAQALINSLVPEQRQPGSGPMSDADLALFQQSLPRLINTPEGNRQIIEAMRGIAEYDAQGAEIVNQVRSGELTRAEGMAALQNRVNPLGGMFGGDNGAPTGNDGRADRTSGGANAAPVTIERAQSMTPEDLVGVLRGGDISTLPRDVRQALIARGQELGLLE